MCKFIYLKWLLHDDCVEANRRNKEWWFTQIFAANKKKHYVMVYGIFHSHD